MLPSFMKILQRGVPYSSTHEELHVNRADPFPAKSAQNKNVAE